MLSPKRNGNRIRIGSAKNALRRSVRQVRHTDARNAASGTLPATLQPNIRTLGGACIASVHRVMQNELVLCAKESKRKNTLAPQRGRLRSLIADCACCVNQKRVARGCVQPVANANRSNNFLTLLQNDLLGKMAHKHAMRAAKQLCKQLSASALLLPLQPV